MNRKNKIKTDQDEHFEALGQLLTQLRTHLASEKKGTYGDYLRLLEFYREASDEQVKEIVVSWVDNENLETQPLP
ncbi:MAG TPA: hypothetical protein VEX68_24565 [Bryobacteraceae bacterium]|nr:hypothetical protein [Bryobacteraceae bacterium]